MICFGIKTDQEVKENGYMGPTLKYKKIKNKSKGDGRERTDQFFFFFFFSLTSLFDIRKSDRQNSSGEEAKCSTQ